MKKLLFLSLLLGLVFTVDAQRLRIPKTKTKIYHTYVKEHPDGTKYAGRTSGYREPEKNIANRDRNHHMNDKGYKPAQLDKSFNTLSEAKKREQQLIDKFGGAIRHGGTSGNTINAIRQPANRVKI